MEKIDPRLEDIDTKKYCVAVLEQPNFDKDTGERLSKPSVVTFNEKDWLQHLTFGPMLGFVVQEIINLPKGWKQLEVKSR